MHAPPQMASNNIPLLSVRSVEDVPLGQPAPHEGCQSVMASRGLCPEGATDPQPGSTADKSQAGLLSLVTLLHAMDR